MKKISIITPCYNEQSNVEALYNRVREIFSGLTSYKYEHIFIDNCSSDSTVEILKVIAKKDRNVKVIVNSRNFGHIRSPIHAIKQSSGDAAMFIACDFQDPPDLIPEFIEKWEEGYKIVIGVRKQSLENPVMSIIRKTYYKVLNSLSEVELVKDYMGFGLYDVEVIDIVRQLDDPYPYFRGLVCEIGFEKAIIEYTHPKRRGGITKNNIYTLYDMAMLGISSYSKIPLRLAIFFGAALSAFSILTSAIYFIYKLLYWDSFAVGIAPLVMGLFFFSSVQLLLMGIIGEYIGTIYTQVKRRPYVVEKERINFEGD